MISFFVGYGEIKESKIWFFLKGRYNLYSVIEKEMYKNSGI